ncbi:hypothetical protein P5663_20920 (plasmid) [Priestia flexa]|uniref:hypothetical protein n=1 Tax=Priestia flexa TaxID=86664 RepID=UPI00240D2210|nr:hypothetical protein [Priestia flexa]WEZ10389.1 hypothetical protein P5663_20920 [Priestia flexa]
MLFGNNQQRNLVCFPYTVNYFAVHSSNLVTKPLRMIQRNISPKQIYDAYTKGTKYSDPDYPKATVYHYKGIAVAREGNTLTTVYNQAKPKARWKKK